MVLVVDDEEAVLVEARKLLEAFGMIVLTAPSTAEALQLVGSTRIDVALIDWRLRGHDDGIALGRSLRRHHRIPFVLFSGYLDTETTGKAYKQGASDVIDKPLRRERLLAAVEFALQPMSQVAAVNSSPIETACGVDSISRRWGKMVLKASSAKDDPSTESAAAKAAGVSTGVFRKLCKACAVSARATRDLSRFLRALLLAQEDGSKVSSHLASTEQSTRVGLFGRAGLPLDSRFVLLREFVRNQKLVSYTNECLRELAHLAANDPRFFVEPDEEQTGTAFEPTFRTRPRAGLGLNPRRK